MMFNSFRAEWIKVIKNYKLASFTIWNFPIGALAFFGIVIALSLLTENLQGQGIASMSSGQWTTDSIGVWSFINAFPANVFGRMFPLAFMAVMFAGEYQWGTWKNIVPRSRRSSILISKIFSLVLLVAISMLITSIVVGMMQALGHRVFDIDYGPNLTWTVIWDFARDYLLEMSLGLASLLILTGIAALAAFLTRSIIGSILTGFGFSIAEPLSVVFLPLLGDIFNKPEISNLYRYFPSYNVDNIRSWILKGNTLANVPPGFTAELGLMASALILMAWIVGLVAVTMIVFQRQDITS